MSKPFSQPRICGQLDEHAVAIFDNEFIEEDHAPDPVRALFGHLRYHCPKTMRHEGDVVEAALLSVRVDRADTVPVPVSVARAIAQPASGHASRAPSLRDGV